MFNIGDIVTGKKVRSIERYSITNEDSICEVVKTYPHENTMRVKVLKTEDKLNERFLGTTHFVECVYFKLVKSTRKEIW